MNPTTAAPLELLKTVLANLRDPAQLNDHPWARSIAGPRETSPGARLVELVGQVFPKMLPASAPRAGKRLDTRWGAFGILAAQYFAPLTYGTPTPGSQREAWASLDHSIYLFVFGRVDGLSPDKLACYRFAANESEPAPNSTLSDWHRKGLEQLVGLVTLELEHMAARKKPRAKFRRIMIGSLAIFATMLLLLTAGLSWKAWGLYQHALALKQQAQDLAGYLHPVPDLTQIPEFASKLHALRSGLDAWQNEAAPLLWLTPYFGQLPRLPGEISQAADLLSLAQNLVSAADEGLTAVLPALRTTFNNDQSLDVMGLVTSLQDTSPELLNAQLALTQAQAARARLDLGRLTPGLRQLITSQVDPLFETVTGTLPVSDALALIRIAPRLLGIGKAGPQTYLVLIQNEDELRPTGGFLTAAGSVVIMNGKLIGLNIESADLVDDPLKPYPLPPWQFQTYMNIGMLMFRDANWFTNYPTTVSWAEYLYSYTRAVSAAGVIAIDSHLVVRLLKTLGPIQVEGVSYPITSENVMQYMRSAKEYAPADFSGQWDRKQYIGRLARALIEKILQLRGREWSSLMPIVLELLNEKHLLLQFDDEQATRLVARHNWDGAVNIPANSDFNMLVDANLSYNKATVSMETSLDYTIDLTNLNRPTGLLVVRQINHSTREVPCLPRYSARFAPGHTSSPYVMDECYWSYLRLYLPAGTKLLRSTPHALPAESTMLGEDIPARTDDLGSEEIHNAQVFGTMTLTPTRTSRATEFEFLLPADVLRQAKQNNLWAYHLKLQKQPGTLARSMSINLRLPAGATLVNTSLPLTNQHGTWTAQLELRNDLQIEVSFRIK